MRINVTFRHMETSVPVRDYVEEKLPKVKKYIEEPVEAQVVLSVEKKIRHKAEATLNAKGITIKASEETSDMYAAIDGMLDKLDRQLKRYKDKIKKHKPLSGRERRVEKTIYTAESIDEAPIVGDILTGSLKPDGLQIKAAAAELRREETVSTAPSKVSGSSVVTLMISLPSDRLQRKADQYKGSVVKHAAEYNVDPALVFAVIQTESSFNPMARSHVPAYGLMQIVPRSAGLDASKKVLGKKVLLSPSYLYDSENNIGMGSAYLHILSKRYMRAVKNEESRLYCVIAAYNTGSGNVARAFTGEVGMTGAAPVINSMSPEKVYQTLIDNLPHRETVGYLKKVTDRMKHYSFEQDAVL